jgi:uncharacterized secreted protein with C-terminal beta-propeller domain
MRSTFSVFNRIISLSIFFLLSNQALSHEEEIFVRLNANPLEAPYYIFSHEPDGESETVELIKGATYKFTRTDGGHPFNMGAAWREADVSLDIVSTGTENPVSGIASIVEGQQLIVSIPEDFAGNSIAYYCYVHSAMVASLSVVDTTDIVDTDGDGIADVLDNDDDGDGILDQADVFPLDPNEVLDTDSDGIGNNADTDDDGDGIADETDAFPLDSDETVDTDNDGIGNNADTDDDNDTVLDTNDVFPLDATESVDTDGDGIGNNADTDDDNDGVSDNEDLAPLDNSISLSAQMVSVQGNPSAVIGQQVSIGIGYDVNNGDNQLTGIGFRIHYDSSVLTFIEVADLLNTDIIVNGQGPFADTDNFDNDVATDNYISVAWASLFGTWPNVELPTQLMSLAFKSAETVVADSATHINFSATSSAAGFEFEAQNYHLEIVRASWDFDKNGEADALTDGLLLLRQAFGLVGDSLTNDVIALDSPLSSSEVEDVMASATLIADIDGNGVVDALTDGLLLLRHLFGLSGESLISDVIAPDATRTSAEAIEQYLNAYMPGASSQSEQQASGLLVPVGSSDQLTAEFSQSYSKTFGVVAEVSVDMMDAMPTAEAAADGGAGGSSGESFTTTYTLEAAIDEHDFVKYDGNHLFIAPSYSMVDDCCFIFEEPIALEDDAIEVGAEVAVADEYYHPVIPEERVIKIMATHPDQAEVSDVGAIPITDNRTVEGLYTNDTQLAAISSSGWWGLYGDVFMSPSVWRQQTLGLSVYDIADVSAPQLDWQFELEGGFVTSRKKGDVVYLVARHTPSFDGWIDYPTTAQLEQNQDTLSTITPDIILPKAYVNGEQIDFLSATDCMMINEQHELAPDQFGYPTMTMLIAINVAEQEVVNSTCYLESTSGVYVSENAIYFIQTDYAWTDTRTLIHRFNLSSDLAYTGSGEVQGQLMGSGEVDFRINEHEGHLRVVSSQWTGDVEDRRDHQLTVLKQSPDQLSMDPVAVLPNADYPQEIGKPNEDIYGVRFFGDTLYLVTFERTDPLYVLDLSDQSNPIVAGELEVTGFSDFLHPVNDDLLLGLGQDEDGLVKLELFNVANIEEPFSLATTSLGYGSHWTHSPARYNRHAFTYQQLNESTDRFSVPINMSYSTPDMGYVQENRLYLFNLHNKNMPDSASFMESGYISGGYNNWWNSDRQRAFFHGDSVFYINGDNVLSSFWPVPED